MKGALLLALVVLVTLDAILLITKRGLLVYEHHVVGGQGSYVVAGYGDLGANVQDSLVCRYFTGTDVVVRKFWYSTDSAEGATSCPFLAGL